ncbi:hypothetical protein EDD16DRAFT_1633686 [Pisolithus croceorrhizus]|nr:hypothetical protein EV401DRAFT_2061146 [Pisolithus croceorrhizus]KAI6105129.1 hypothetical protein EDD16DRAFT_1633686 [Pisolithus croceorrhizus]KAI6165492.1 hypothetical protein EDD17DRAFT_232434 [Pisolithus thermaeus]
MLQDLSHMDRITQLQDEIQRILVIMSSSISYLTNRSNFLQVSEEIPITKQRNPDKFDSPELFEANKRELVDDLIMKAKQIEVLIQSLPAPEPEEQQAKRLQELENEMTTANQEYTQAVERAKNLHGQFSELLRTMLDAADIEASLLSKQRST